MDNVALLLTIVPGFSQLYRGRLFLGSILFLLFLIASNGLAVLLLFFPDSGMDGLFWLSLFSCSALWIFSFVETLRHTLFWDEEAFQARRESLFREGTRLYLEGQFPEAEKAFVACLRLDPRNPDILIYLGMVKRNLGDAASALRFLKKCGAWDASGKWSQAIEEEKAKAARGCQNDSIFS